MAAKHRSNFTLNLDTEQLNCLEALAHRGGVSVASLVREAIGGYLDAPGAKRPRGVPANAVLGRGQDGDASRRRCAAIGAAMDGRTDGVSGTEG